MRVRRTWRAVPLALTAAGILTLSACGGGSGTDEAGGSTDMAEADGTGESTEVDSGTGAMGDANFAVTTYMDTLWPIEGNPYADAASAEAWCTTYATDGPAAVAMVAEYLVAEPDIAAADPAEVSTAIDEYLTNNCYLLEE